MSEFVAGFAGRHEAVAHLLAQAFAPVAGGFEAADIRARALPDVTPRSFAPADPSHNPTEGWDPFAATLPSAATDPVAAAHAAGYAEGLAAAREDMTAAVDREQAMLATLTDALRTDDRVNRGAIARQLRQTVLHLVQRMIGEVGVSTELLASRIEAASELLADSAESAIIRVHPADVTMLDGRLPKTMFAIGDEGVARGSFVLESASTLVEDGPDIWLEQLSQAIDRVAVPPAC